MNSEPCVCASGQAWASPTRTPRGEVLRQRRRRPGRLVLANHCWCISTATPYERWGERGNDTRGKRTMWWREDVGRLRPHAGVERVRRAREQSAAARRQRRLIRVADAGSCVCGGDRGVRTVTRLCSTFAAGPPLHPEGAAGPVVARLVLVVVLVRRHACGGPRGARRTRDGRAGARRCV